jgi:hypothetical protein
MTRARDRVAFKTIWTIVKFSSRYQEKMEELHQLLHSRGIGVDQALKLGYKPYEVLKVKGNLMLNEGLNTLWTLVCGGAATPYNNANARIGVGDGTAVEDPTQTGLQGLNRFWKGMDAGYPTFGTAQKAVWRATFSATEANFAWNEITVVNAADDTGMNLNRKVQAMGTKASGTVWVATLEITGA